MASTLSIELLQLSVISGRDSSLGDLVSNSLGGGIGILLAKQWRLWILPDSRQATRLAIHGWIAWVGILALSAWALRPSPTSPPWFVQTTPDLANFAQFPGTLVSASINDDRVTSGFLDPGSTIYTHLTQGTVTVTPTVMTGSPTDRSKIAPILSIFDRQQREVLLTGQKGTAFVFRSRTNTSTLRMREPTIGLARVFQAGDTITLRANRLPSGVTLSATSPTVRIESTYQWHVFMLWNALLPFNLTLTPQTHMLSAVWAFGLILLPAYWSVRTRRMPWLLVSGGVVIVLLGLLPLLYGYPPTPWWGWAGTGLGWCVSVLLGKRSSSVTKLP